MSTMGRWSRAVVAVSVCWVATVAYLWLMVADSVSTITVALPPAFFSVGLGYGTAFAYGFYRYYGAPVSEEWLRIPLSRLLSLGGLGVFGGLGAMILARAMMAEWATVAATDLQTFGAVLGLWLVGPTLLCLPVGYFVGAWVSPEALD